LDTHHQVLCDSGHFAPKAFERKFIELRVWEPWMVEDAQFDVGYRGCTPRNRGQAESGKFEKMLFNEIIRMGSCLLQVARGSFKAGRAAR
jgi:hypothetical protein